MLELTGDSLTLEQVEAVARADERDVVLAAAARARVERARSLVDELASAEEPVYGVTTGFGRLAEVRIPRARRAELQVNLVRSHAAGVGPLLSDEEVRAMTLLRANALAKGHSGCRVEVIERLLDFLRHGLHAVVPSFGSVGASGDLAPLAAVALALTGEGEVTLDGERLSAAEALARRGVEPLILREKEGLALINGTQATTALGTLALLAAERAVDTAEVAGAATLEGLRGTPVPFAEAVHRTRPHRGQQESA
ncbi:MAG: aromatic amino acid lyase, partial [Gemmatimonadota bacterium]